MSKGSKVYVCQQCGVEFTDWPFLERQFCSRKCARIKHGDAARGVKLYWVWAAMIGRCHNESNKKYSDYGGRGIFVCDEWRNDYSKFRQWSADNGHMEGLEIDRKDVNDGYYPENCRWATHGQNIENRRPNKKSKHKFKGVQFRFGKWRARATISGKGIYAGAFATIVEAAMAYDDVVFEARGECAYLNFPERKGIFRVQKRQMELSHAVSFTQTRAVCLHRY